MSMTVDHPRCEVASPDDLHAAVAGALRQLDLTWDQLAEQGASGRFVSERARLTWLAIRDLVAFR